MITRVASAIAQVTVRLPATAGDRPPQRTGAVMVDAAGVMNLKIDTTRAALAAVGDAGAKSGTPGQAFVGGWEGGETMNA